MFWISLVLLALSPAETALAHEAGAAPGRAETTARHLAGQCDARVRMVNGRTLTDSRPRDAEAPVRMHYLLDNRVDGCSVPVIAVDSLPEADRAVGRIFGDTVQPEPR